MNSAVRRREEESPIKRWTWPCLKHVWSFETDETYAKHAHLSERTSGFGALE